MADITLRQVKGSPLTIEELDTNFINMNNDLGTKLSSSAYTATDVLSKLLTVDGSTSGLDADLLDGYQTSVSSANNTIPVRNSSGIITSAGFIGPLSGNVAGNVTGNVFGTLTGDVVGNCSGNSSNVTGIIAVANGGTGGTTSSTARTGIGAAASGANSDITSITGLTTPLSAAQGGTGVTSISALVTSLGLDTASDARFDSLGIGTNASGTTGEIRATNNITAYYSDDRLKTKLGNIEKALDKVKTLNGFYYHANDKAVELGYEVKKEVGVSAQEVNAIMPEVVAPAPIDEQYLTVRYERLVPLLIEAIKELSAEVDKIKGVK